MTSIVTTVITEKGRICTKCRTFKNWSCFYKQAKHSTGYNSCCKMCKLGQVAVYDKRPKPPKPGLTLRILETRSWSEVYPVDTSNYWDKGDSISLGTNPHPFIYSKIKKYETPRPEYCHQ